MFENKVVNKLVIEKQKQAQLDELLKLKRQAELEENCQLLIAKLSDPTILSPEDIKVLDKILKELS